MAAADHVDPEVFEEAADLIEQAGWYHGSGTPGSFCAAVSIQLAIYNRRWFPHGLVEAHDQALADHLDLPAGPGKYPSLRVDAIAAWNDAPERTEQEVLDALRGTAKAVRKRQEGIR